MGREKGAPPSRRGPSRSGRASFQADPAPENNEFNATSSGACATSIVSVDQATSTDAQGKDASATDDVSGEMNERNMSTSNGTIGLMKQANSNEESKSDSSTEIGAGGAQPTSEAPPVVTPRGRGRPRKKSLESKEQTTKKSSALSKNGGDSTVRQSTAVASSTSVSTIMGQGQPNGGNKNGTGGRGTRQANVEGGDSAGNESDEWSENDEVHHLPKEVKAQFGNVVWAKMRKDPPWPGLVWDPRFLGEDKMSRKVARLAYASLGKSQLVKFYDTKRTFATVTYKNITPFDPEQLPTNLKACNSSKKKELLKEDVQMAIKATGVRRADRLKEMHDVGRFGAKKEPGKKQSRSRTGSNSNSSDNGGDNSGGKSASSSATPASGKKKAAVGKSRGRPRKTPVKELDEDAPSTSSSGPEYDLPVPAPPETESDEKEDGEPESAAAEPESAAGEPEKAGKDEPKEDETEEPEKEPPEEKGEEKQDDAGEKSEGAAHEDEGEDQKEEDQEEDEEEEEGVEDQEEEDEMGMGDDDDEEEYTAEADDDEDEADEEDERLLEESYASTKRNRKRDRSRKSTAAPGEHAEGKASKRSRRSSSSRSPRGIVKEEEKPRAPGDGKARALAAVRAFISTLPKVEYGRDEGWEPKEDDRTGSSGSGSKRARSSGSGSGNGDKGDWQGKEKRPKGSKSASAREEKQKEEIDAKQRISQMKASSEPVWLQHRRSMQEGGGATGAGGSSKPSTPTGGTGGNGTKEGSSSSGLNAQIQMGRKLTQRLGKASVEGSFNKEEVLKALKELGELEPSVELLHQSGCGKAVAAVRKYFHSTQVKHNDKEVAGAASNLRSRWMEALGKGTSNQSSTGSSSTSVTATGASSGLSQSHANAPGRARSDPTSGASSSLSSSSSSKKHHSMLAKSGSGEASPRPRSSTQDHISGSSARERKVKEEGGRGGTGGRPEGGRYGGGGDEEHGSSKSGHAESGGGVAAATENSKNKKLKVASPDGDGVASKIEDATTVDTLPEPRRRALGMLQTILGSTVPAVERCKAIENELYESQGKEISKHYLRRLRTAVFSMEGSASQRLRDKVMSEMVLPRDFVTKSCDELRSLAGMV